MTQAFHNQGPADNYDLDFRESIVAPCASYEDTLVLIYGWNREDAAQEIECTQLAIGAVYKHFGGGTDTLPILPSKEAVVDYVWSELGMTRMYGVAGNEDKIANISLRYLTGEGDDYQLINELAS
jgi:hypothetical protein